MILSIGLLVVIREQHCAEFQRFYSDDACIGEGSAVKTTTIAYYYLYCVDYCLTVLAVPGLAYLGPPFVTITS